MPNSIKTILLPVLILTVFLLSVIGFFYIKYPDMDCENKNTTLQEHTFDSKEYKLELIKLLKNSDLENTKFWFGKYIDSSHITIKMQNKDVCATGLITVLKMGKEGEFMNNLMAAKGKSYGGPLIGVKLKFNENEIDPEIILTSVIDIID